MLKAVLSLLLCLALGPARSFVAVWDAGSGASACGDCDPSPDHLDEDGDHEAVIRVPRGPAVPVPVSAVLHSGERPVVAVLHEPPFIPPKA